ncbi:MAG: hypothetical protein JW889_06550 [Verrucomicrobia bacterium]|nr:hypothetical protein [Verrucomicrobiota bacterium]
MRWLVRSLFHVLAVAGVLLVSLAAHSALTVRDADRFYAPKEPGSGAKLLAVGDRGDLFFVWPGSDSNWIEAIDDHGKVKGRFEGVAPATCACVDSGSDWLLAGDAQGRVMRWRIKDGTREQLLEIKDDTGAPRAVTAIVPSSRGVFVFSFGLLGELDRAVFSQRFDLNKHARIVFRKDGHRIECVTERKGLVVTSNGTKLYGFDPSKPDPVWTLDTGGAPAAVVDVPRARSILAAKDSLRLIDDRKGEIEEERECAGVMCAVVFRDAESIYAGLNGGTVDQYVQIREHDARGLSASDRERQRHDHNSFTFGRERRWNGFQGAVTALIAAPNDKQLFASDSQGNLYVMRIGEDDQERDRGR